MKKRENGDLIGLVLKIEVVFGDGSFGRNIITMFWQKHVLFIYGVVDLDSLRLLHTNTSI